jgi:hypothetical protein
MPHSEDTLKDVKGRIALVRKRYKKCVEADRENRDAFTDDMEFTHCPGKQWDVALTSARGADRPKYEFNKIRPTVKRIVNEMRQNRPAWKLRPTEDSDKDLAETREGILRNIASVSDFESVMDSAAEYQVTGGYAAWRIVTEYSSDTAFDQDIFIRGIKNPLTVYCDPAAIDMTGADAGYWVNTDKIDKELYKASWPDAEQVDFETDDEDDEEWEDDDRIRIAEHWYKVPVKKKLLLLNDGKTVDSSELGEVLRRGLQVVKERETTCHDIYSAIYSGKAELTKPAKWAGSLFPWVRVYGERVVINGKTYWFGLTRFAKDPQRSYNGSRTSVIESIARAPLSQVWATAHQALGLEKEWAMATAENSPLMIYNHDPQAPGPPIRIGGADVPIALIEEVRLASEEIKAVTGIYDASLGNRSNETSGVAIRSREAQGQIVTFNYADNMAKAAQQTGKILDDLVPKIFDTQRHLRILGSDLSEKYVTVNQPDASGKVLNDLSRGKFDLTVTQGPSFATRRQEAAEILTQMAANDEGLMATSADLVYKSLDVPYADEIAERRRLMLPPQIQQHLNADKKLPPEVQAAMAQVEQQGQMLQEQGKLVEQAAIEAQKETATAKSAKSEVQVALANLKTEEANFKTMQAQFEKLVAEKKAELQSMATNIDVKELQVDMECKQAEQVKQHAESAISQIDELVKRVESETQEFLSSAADVVVSKTRELNKPKPKAKSVRAKRVGGKYQGQIEYDDGSKKNVSAERINGELVSTIQ